MLCDEILGRFNFVGSIIWEKVDSPRIDATYFSARHDYILTYAKDKSELFSCAVAYFNFVAFVQIHVSDLSERQIGIGLVLYIVYEGGDHLLQFQIALFAYGFQVDKLYALACVQGEFAFGGVVRQFHHEVCRVHLCCKGFG